MSKEQKLAFAFGLLALGIICVGIGVYSVIPKSDVKPVEPTTVEAKITQPARPQVSKTVEANSQKMWTPTGIIVKLGEVIKINASGTATACTNPKDAAYKWVGPDGWGYDPHYTWTIEGIMFPVIRARD
jgi:hypothetical protein